MLYGGYPELLGWTCQSGFAGLRRGSDHSSANDHPVKKCNKSKFTRVHCIGAVGKGRQQSMCKYWCNRQRSSIVHAPHHSSSPSRCDRLDIDAHIASLLGSGALPIDSDAQPGCRGVVKTDVKGQDRLVDGLGKIGGLRVLRGELYVWTHK